MLRLGFKITFSHCIIAEVVSVDVSTSQPCKALPAKVKTLTKFKSAVVVKKPKSGTPCVAVESR